MNRRALLIMIVLCLIACLPIRSADLPVVGIANKAAGDPIMTTARNSFAFRVFGRVESSGLTTDRFVVDDGSGKVRVVAPGHLANAGCYVSATGTLDPSTTPPTLTGASTDVVLIGSCIAPPIISVNDFPNYRVFQRTIGGASKSISITGTCSNANWSRIDARIVRQSGGAPVVDWTTIDSTPSAGTFSGSLTVPQGGWYRIEVRACDSLGRVVSAASSANKWGVGMIILCIGQSNMVGRAAPPYTTASDLAALYSNAGVWEHLADPWDRGSPAGAIDGDSDVGGSMIPALANALLQTYSFPIAFVPCARNGSPLYVRPGNYGWSYRNPSNHYDTSTLYGQSITKAQNAGGVELIVMHQGERDLLDGRSEAQYEADFATMIGNYRQDLRPGIPIFICQLGTVGLGSDSGVVGIRNAQRDLDNGTNVLMGATAMDLARSDEWHYTGPSLNVLGGRLANATKYYFGNSSYYRGPSISSARFSDGNRNQVIVTLSHRGGTDISPASGITGFEVFDNGSPVGITSAVRHSSNAVRLALSHSISSSHTATLRYLYGMTPNVSGLVRDNSPLALPLENTAAPITIAGP